ncbi:7,8-dihydropterin-6-yl-methyl-4-(beta-D-ribofuranosyl)aminobenzene 5'-phosphate synthase [Hypnocyclicus thermotrophus]|uniref:7, 8-dihydropterin-6-yl-methyl-4-(Beta-D-ribofuranosyl)aminobenzene 5'-phosphate synthase n=1 Tax=Hypnocyclicus thermotrophus TaxID=1627895 RepID=A0AA46DZU1_9FUSO|nr:MBL fold metallo-hydrolase [Hypnocyclicus thermotrophus]TDT71950.1 7,8-dihydropterin-6-yl-methyl-4-(beta-D-ribofuranosyl)aminobenzene 5'-phosphate synthase [Hypnocyclicus thermotrophus]
MEITVLIENLVYNQGLFGEHGLSLHILDKETSILFDTGQTENFLLNAKTLGIDINKVKYTILSHGHYDHTGGLKSLLEKNNKIELMVKKDIFQKKYSNSTGNIREIGLDNKISKYNNIKYLDKNIVSLTENIFIITKINNYNDFENDEKKLFVKENNKYVVDKFIDEVFLVLKNNDDTLTIITGCAHNGIINILKTTKEYFLNNKIKQVIGGFHLKGKSKERIDKTINELIKLEIQEIYINHCSGIEFFSELKNKNSNIKVIYAYTGSKIIS